MIAVSFFILINFTLVDYFCCHGYSNIGEFGNSNQSKPSNLFVINLVFLLATAKCIYNICQLLAKKITCLHSLLFEDRSLSVLQDNSKIAVDLMKIKRRNLSDINDIICNCTKYSGILNFTFWRSLHQVYQFWPIIKTIDEYKRGNLPKAIILQ